MKYHHLLLNPNLRVSWDESGAIILDIHGNSIYSLNMVGAIMLKGIEQGDSENDIAIIIAQKYQIPIERVISDLQKFESDLYQKKFLQSVTPEQNENNEQQQACKHILGGSYGRWRFTGLFSALYWLLAIEFRLRVKGFDSLYNYLKAFPVCELDARPDIVSRICKSIDIAGTFYLRHALCLQRSAATLCLLRCNGIPATMIVGASRYPFKAHAWVEVNGVVVNDRSGVRVAYHELDRI